uniref:Retinoblastoma binding protein 6 n=1 Tax=Nothobranchius pienaari TaxID=704102 RepID=A0A1A8MQA8_9TELE
MTHIHYKFSSKLSYDTVVFDGPHITLTDLKRQIMGRERLKAGDCDLQIANAQTKEEYTEDEGSKSTSSSKTNRSERSDPQFPHHAFGVGRAMSDQSSTKALSYFSMMQKSNLADADVSEEDKIKVMISQSSMNLNTKPGTVLPENYTCYRCRNTGHHIRNCPMNGQDKNFQGPPKIRKSTGIPNSLLVEVKDPSIKGVMLTNCGRYAIPAIDAEAYAVGKKEKPPFIPLEQPKCESKGDPVPAEFLCLMCRDLLGDAVVIPCCGSSYCDDCIRSALLDSEDHVCPTCGQSDVSPDTLSSDVPPEATAAEKSATTENASSTFLPPMESQLEISHDGNEGKTGDDSAAVPHSLLPPDKTASDVPDNHEPQHRKSRHHRKRSSSSSRSSRRCKGAERSPYDINSLEVERQSYLQWNKDYQEWYDKYFSTFINHFHQMLLPPPLLPPPPPPPYPPFSFCPPPHDSHSSRLDVCSPSSETSSSQRSSPSHSSNDFHSMASHHSNDSPLPYKANDGYSSPSESSSDGHSAPCNGRAKLREFSDSCKEKSRPVTKSSEGANLQDLKQDQNQQIFKTGGTSGQLSHGKKQKKTEAGRAKDSSGLDSTCDLRQEKRSRYDDPRTHKDGPSVRHKESVGGDSKSVHPPLEKDQNNHASKANKDSRLGKEQRRKSGQDTDCRRAKERENKKKPCNDLAPERRGQLGGSKSPDFRSEENQKRKWEETEKSVKESPTQRCKGPKTRAAEPQRCDSKCVKPPARETQKPEEMKPRSVAQKNVWEGGLKVLPQKKISININLDVKRLEDTSGQQNSSKVDVCMQENEEQTGKEKNKEPSDTEVNRTKESSPGSYVTTEELTCVLEEVRENKAAAEEEGRENKEMEDVDLWHCALSGVKDEEEDHMMGKEETLKGAPRETREEPQRSSSMTNKSRSLYDGFSVTSKRDRSSLGSGGVGGSREKKTVVKRLEGNFPGQAQSTQNHLKQMAAWKIRCLVLIEKKISRSKSTNDEKQAIVCDTDTSARPTRSHMTGYNEKKQQSTFGGRNRDSVTLRGREEMKEQRWSENRGMLAPSGGGGGADSPLHAERDGEIRTEREKERTREGERLKDSKRLRQGSWGGERRRDCDASVQNRNHISSSSVSCDRERRDQLRGAEQSRTRFSNSSRESVREIPSVSRYTLQPSHNFPKRDRKRQRLSAEYRDQSRPTRIQQSPPSLFHCHSADKFHVLVEPSMSFEREFSHWELTRNSRTQKREPEKVLKTRAKETPVSGRGRGESRWEDEARKLDERRRSSSDSNRSSSRH